MCEEICIKIIKKIFADKLIGVQIDCVHDIHGPLLLLRLTCTKSRLVSIRDMMTLPLKIAHWHCKRTTTHLRLRRRLAHSVAALNIITLTSSNITISKHPAKWAVSKQSKRKRSSHSPPPQPACARTEKRAKKPIMNLQILEKSTRNNNNTHMIVILLASCGSARWWIYSRTLMVDRPVDGGGGAGAGADHPSVVVVVGPEHWHSTLCIYSRDLLIYDSVYNFYKLQIALSRTEEGEWVCTVCKYLPSLQFIHALILQPIRSIGT